MNNPIKKVLLGEEPKLPLVTFVLIVILLAVFAAECMLGLDPTSRMVRPTVRTLVLMGGSSWYTTVGNQEWYRLVSAPFLHLDAPHLLFNLVVLYFAAAPLERLLGQAWLLAIYTTTALGGSTMSLATNAPHFLSIGASGAIMGLFAAGLICTYRLPPGTDRTEMRTTALLMLIAGLAPALLPQDLIAIIGLMDVAAHLGGALSGAAVGAAIIAYWSGDKPMPEIEAGAKFVAATGIAAMLGTATLIAGAYVQAWQAATH